MGYKCYLCGNMPDKVKKISLHKFPSNCEKTAHILKQWLAVCNLSEMDTVSGLRICSCHFKDDDLKMEFTKKKVEHWSIPSINVPNPSALTKDQDVPKVNLQQKTPNNISVAQGTGIYSIVVQGLKMGNCTPCPVIKTDVPDNINPENFQIKINKDEHDVSNVNKNSGVSPQIPGVTVAEINEDGFEIGNGNEELFVERVIKEEYLEDSGNEEHLQTNDATTSQSFPENDQSSPPRKKRRFYDPRFISEIQISDFATPRMARRTLNFIQSEHRKKSAQIKQLSDKNRRLEKRVRSLKVMILQLQDWFRQKFQP